MPAFLDELMSTGEHIQLTARRHWITVVGATVVYTALFLVLVLIAGVGFGAGAAGWSSALAYGSSGLAVVVLVILGITILRWYYRLFVVTTRRVIQTSGILYRRVSDTNLDKVNDVVLTQGPLGRLLGYGTIEIISGSDVGVDSFDRIADPMGFKRAMLDNKEDFDSLARAAVSAAAGGSSGIEELAELRAKGLISEEEFQAKRAELLERF
jgi:uncharacterized membrane protein YdbT with pleckstrin-like domain